MSQSRILSMQMLRGFSGFVGFLNLCKPSKKIALPIHLDGGFPLSSGIVPKHSFNACFAIDSGTNVHLIRGVGRRPQIFNTVISLIQVDMVNLLGKMTMMPKENQPVFQGVNFFYSYANTDLTIMPRFLLAPSNLPGSVTPRVFSPNQSTIFGIVVKKTPYEFLRDVCAGKIKIAHAVAPAKQWFEKWPIDVAASLGRASIPKVNGVCNV